MADNAGQWHALMESFTADTAGVWHTTIRYVLQWPSPQVGDRFWGMDAARAANSAARVALVAAREIVRLRLWADRQVQCMFRNGHSPANVDSIK